VEWLEPWYSTEVQNASSRQPLVDQLARETKSGHELHGVPVQLIGRNMGDDVLFEILDGSRRVAEVHLGWQGQGEPPWPLSAIFSSLEEWRVKRMIPDHKDWVEGEWAQ
jgi:hypothetical protein